MAENFNELISENSWRRSSRTVFLFHHCPQTGVSSSHREHRTFTPAYSLHRLHLSAWRRVYLGCDCVWHLLAVNVRDAGDVTRPQLAAEPKPRGNWDSAGYLDICIEVAENWSEDESRMVWFDSKVKARSHFILALIMSNLWNSFGMPLAFRGLLHTKKTIILTSSIMILFVRSEFLQTWSVGCGKGTLSSIPQEFQSREKLIQHRLPNLTCDHINYRKCVKQRAELHSH